MSKFFVLFMYTLWDKKFWTLTGWTCTLWVPLKAVLAPIIIPNCNVTVVTFLAVEALLWLFLIQLFFLWCLITNYLYQKKWFSSTNNLICVFKLIFLGSAPIDKAILEYFMSIDIPIMEAYGLSESLSMCTFNYNEPGRNKVGSVGKVRSCLRFWNILCSLFTNQVTKYYVETSEKEWVNSQNYRGKNQMLCNHSSTSIVFWS